MRTGCCSHPGSVGKQGGRQEWHGMAAAAPARHLPKRYPAPRVSKEAGNSSTVAATYAATKMRGPRGPLAAMRASSSYVCKNNEAEQG